MIESQLREIIRESALKLGSEIQIPEFTVELPKNLEHGDYASNIALLLAKTDQKSPREIAQKIIDNIKDSDQILEKTEIAGPGFINFKISTTALEKIIPKILSQGSDYGLHPKNSQKVLVEFVSANPTGPLHLGHARPAFLGDAISRLLIAAGYEVTREFYINDAGKQVETLGKSIYARYCELLGQKIELAQDAYPGEYVIDIAKKLLEFDGEKWLNRENYLPRFIEFGVEYCLENIRTTLQGCGIEFDSWYSEKSLYKKNAIAHLIEDYQSRGMLYEAEQATGTEDKIRREESKAARYAHKQLGGTFLKTSQFGDEEDRIILRQDGTPVYLTADIAYHQEKFERGFERLIDIFGADHSGHIPRVRACMRALGLDDSKLDFVVVQMVRMIREGEEFRFSKRTGQIIELAEFIEQVGVDVTRVAFLMRSAHTQFDFDLDLALKKSSENPVFYLQYGHARMATLLNKASEISGLAMCPGLLNLPEERNILKKMALYPDVLLGAAQNLEPHRILFYCQDLISEFHTYFTRYRYDERIISDNIELSRARLSLVRALKQTLLNALSVLGISAPEHMEHD